MNKRAIKKVYDGVAHVVFKDPTHSGICALPITPGKSPFASDDNRWSWDGNEMNPTITPSVRGGGDHFFVKAGKVEFCPDAKHDRAGMIVELDTLEGFFDETE